MLRCQFLCYVLKTLFFIKIALKLSYFCKKMQNFRAPMADFQKQIFEPRASGGWGLCPQTPSLQQLSLRPQPPLTFGGWRLRPQTQKLAPHIANFWLRTWFHFLQRPFFGLHLNSGKKSVPFLVETFFALHLICSPEKIVVEVHPPQC